MSDTNDRNATLEEAAKALTDYAEGGGNDFGKVLMAVAAGFRALNKPSRDEYSDEEIKEWAALWNTTMFVEGY